MKILVTGANGFVGRHCCRAAQGAGHEVVGTLRREPAAPLEGVTYHQVGALSGETDWRAALEDVEVVVHAAARAHRRHQDPSDPLPLYRRENCQASVALARQAVTAGVRRFIFISSIAAEAAQRQGPGSVTSAYGLSKWEAERDLKSLAAETGLELVVLRPPTIYGPKAPGAFGQLARAIHRGLPLPLAGIENQRSLLYVGNLTDVILACLDHPEAPGLVSAVSDGRAVSTSELVRAIAKAQGHRARLLPCPQALLRGLGVLTGRQRTVESLLGSRLVDDHALRESLGWQPRWTLETALAETFASAADRSTEPAGRAT